MNDPYQVAFEKLKKEIIYFTDQISLISNQHRFYERLMDKIKEIEDALPKKKKKNNIVKL